MTHYIEVPDEDEPHIKWTVLGKQCSRCWETKPVTQFHLSSNSTGDGYQGYCMDCNREYLREHRSRYKGWHDARKMNVPAPWRPRKECSDCGKVKEASEFHKNKRNRDGLATYCKEDANRRRREAHKRSKG